MRNIDFWHFCCYIGDMKLFKKLADYITRVHELNIVLFKILGIGGISVSIIAGIYSIFEGGIIMVAVNFLAAVLAFLLLLYVEKTGKYVVGYIITEVAVFMVVFAVLYLRGGGIEGALPYFFVFSLVFTFLMFSGKLLIIMETLMSGFYIALIVFSVKCPQYVVQLTNPTDYITEKIFGLFVSSLTLGCVILFYINEYRKQKKIADEAGAAKSTFLANMSHEIRTPINSVIGFNELILAETDNEKIREYATNVDHSGRLLLNVINDVLDFTRLDAGRETLQASEYHLSEEVQEIISGFRVLAEKKNLKLYVEIDELVAITYHGDCEKLKRVLNNLISNAIKYTEEGSVTVKIFVVESDKNSDGKTVSQKLRFEITDTGIGIEEADIEKLFRSYERVDLLKNQNIQGTGLGLAISKKLVELMGGDIRVKSVYGQGSTFSFELNQQVSDTEFFVEPKASEQNAYLAPEARILVVDDNPINILLVKEFLKQTMINFDTAEDGLKCLELVAENKYDMILMDYMMPGMDGVEALGQIREYESEIGSRTPVLVLTADVVEHADDFLLSKGFDAYVSKPIDSRVLKEMVFKFLPSEKVTVIGSGKREETPREVIDGYTYLLKEYDIDLQEGLRYASGSLEQYVSIVKFFDNNYERARKIIEKALEENDIESLVLNFHSLKGNARNIGAVELYELARKLEKKSRAKDIVYINNAVDVFYLEWERAETGIKKLLSLIGDSGSPEADDKETSEEAVSDLIGILAEHISLCQTNPAKKTSKLILGKITDEEDIRTVEKIMDAVGDMDFDEAESLTERLRKRYGET